MDKPLIDILWVLLAGALVFIMQPGFMCLESGLTRSKNSINVAIKNFADMVISVAGFWIIGFGLMFGGSLGGLTGASLFLPSLDQAWPAAFFFFQAMFCGTATTIFSGAVAERMRFSSYIITAAFASSLVYPLFGHWAWGGLFLSQASGWLETRGFVDFAGSTVVHSVGGWVALAALLVIGVRRGRFDENGRPREINGSNLPFTVLGAFLLWAGWFGFNGGSALAMSGQVPGIISRTALAGAMGAVSGMTLGWIMDKRPMIQHLINGSLGGLVAITANCHCVSAPSAAVIGLASGPVCLYADKLLLRLKIDDAVGAIPVHLACGVWGTLAVAFFGDPALTGTGLSFWPQLRIQLIGVGAAFAVSFLIPYAFIRSLNRFFPIRVTGDEEERGLNISEHGAKTEFNSLLGAMEEQARTRNIAIRAPEEAFSEAGAVAKRYNQVMDSLEAAQARTEAIVSKAADAIMTFSQDSLRILSANPAAARMFERGINELTGASFAGLLPRKNRNQALKALLTEEYVEVDFARTGGSDFPAEVIISRAHDRDGPFFTAVIRDISERKAAEAEIQQSELRYRAFFENTGTAICIDSPDGTVTLANNEFARLTGYAKDEIEGRLRFFELLAPQEAERVRGFHQARLKDPQAAPGNYQTVLRDRSGRDIPVFLTVSMIPGGSSCLNSFLDISPLKKARQALDKQQAYFRQLFENSPQAITLVDPEGRVVEINNGFTSMFGYDAEQARGHYNRSLVVPEDRREEVEAFRKAILAGSPVHRETVRRHKDGRRIPVSLLGYPVSVDGTIEGVYYIYTDISERKTFEEQLAHQAFHDSLTGLPNRALFLERLNRSLRWTRRRPNATFAVLLIDLDGFKKINDSLGHLVGDAFLVETAKRLASCLREVDTVARLGGDEFGVMVEEYSSIREVFTVVKRLMNAAAQPMMVGENVLAASASVGVLLRAGGYEKPEDMLRDADTAMYRAKEQGKNLFKVFNRRMHEQALQSLRLENDLREALERDEVELAYQPIHRLEDGALLGFEALARWTHPSLGPISPMRFIPLAEESGLIQPLGASVIRRACRELGQWRAESETARGVTLNVNISARQLSQEGFLEHVAQCLRENGVPPDAIHLELTESSIMDNPHRAIERLHKIKAMGLKLAVDDFGTGYSSLAYLQQFPLDALKIDKSFVSGAGDTAGNPEIIRAIVNLARTLGLTVVAEGVETEDQLALLRTMGCDAVQGYLFSRPLPVNDVLPLLRGLDERPAARRGAPLSGPGERPRLD